MNKPIGIFDSGLGGLTILKALKKELPGESYIYFGDTAHVPYGSKSPQAVTKYSLEIAKFLESQNIKLLVVACNTASALALETLVKEIKVPVLGVIEAGCCAALKKSKNKKISVIGTRATVKSGAYKNLIKALDKKAGVHETACPLFVPFIEEGMHKTAAAGLMAQHYLAAVKKTGADALILGCTHYPIIKPLIKKIMGGGVTLIDSAEEVAKQVRRVLELKKMTAGKTKPSTVIYASDDAKSFSARASLILNAPAGRVILKKL